MMAIGGNNVRFARDNARWLSGGFLLTLFSSFGQTFFIGLSGNDLRAAFHLSGGAFGGFYMVATLALITPVWGVYVFMLLLGISNGFTSTLLGALWLEIYGLANLGGIRAITVSGMVLASALGPGITGALIDLGIPLPTQMLWMAGWCIIASLALASAVSNVRAREMCCRAASSHLQQK